MSKEMLDKIMEAHRIATALSRIMSRETKDPNDAIRGSCLLFVSACLNANWDIEEERINELTRAAVMMARKGREEWAKSENLQ